MIQGVGLSGLSGNEEKKHTDQSVLNVGRAVLAADKVLWGCDKA